MAPWDDLSLDETALLQAIFWSEGSSRLALSDRLAFSKSKTNSLIAGLLDVGLLEESGLRSSTGGRRPETLRLSPGLGVLVGSALRVMGDGPVRCIRWGWVEGAALGCGSTRYTQSVYSRTGRHGIP